VLAQEMQALLAVFGGKDVIHVARQLRGEDSPQIGLVVDDEDLLALREHDRPESSPTVAWWRNALAWAAECPRANGPNRGRRRCRSERVSGAARAYARSR